MQSNPYAESVLALRKVFEVLPEGVSLSKGGVGELALGYHLGHTLVRGDKGADAMDSDGKLYEYKVSESDNYNFHFGARKPEVEEIVFKHFDKIEGAYCASRRGMDIVDIIYVPSEVLVPHLIEELTRLKGGQLIKTYSMKGLKHLVNSN